MNDSGSKQNRPVNVRRHVRDYLLIGAALALLAGCNTLDPTGEWRGLDRPPVPSSLVDVRASQSARQNAPVPAVVNPRGLPDSASAGDGTRLEQDPVPPSAAAQSVDRALTGARDRDALPLAQLLGQAEDHYRNRRQSESEQAFKQLIRRDPLALHAWLRLGNLNHARGDLEGAAQAYRKAIELKPRDAVERDAREKSLANLAIIALEQARVALERLGEPDNSSNARERAGTLAPVLEQRQAALQEEMARLVPRASVKPQVDSLGLALSAPSVPTGTISTPAERIGHVVDVQTGSRITSPVPRVRVESYLPGDFAVQATSAPGGFVPVERAR